MTKGERKMPKRNLGFAKIKQGFVRTLLFAQDNEHTYDVLVHNNLPVPSCLFEQAIAFAQEVARADEVVHIEYDYDTGNFKVL